MTERTRGEIDCYLTTVGSSPQDNGPAFEDLLVRLGDLPEVSPFDRGDNKETTYWRFPDQGVEFLWSDKVLVSVTIFAQPDPDQGYEAYPRPLFEPLPIRPTRHQVERELGAPDEQGEWEGVWIRYDRARHKLRFEFDDDNELSTVSVTDATF